MKNIFDKIKIFCKNEAVLVAAGTAAVISALFVRPDSTYISYMDFRVLALLFCLMLVVAGLKDIGVFSYLAVSLVRLVSGTRTLTLILVFLCFFSGMIITNDVALITFVPFAIMILVSSGKEHLMIPVIVLETIAANLGSMLTPLGNPQNLYLYSAYDISLFSFIITMLPLTVLSLLLIVVFTFFIKNETVAVNDIESPVKPHARSVAFYALLFLVCLLCVMRVIPYYIMLAVIFLAILIFNRKLFKNIDYLLLLTFVFFFVFVGNMQRIAAVRNLISSLIKGKELVFSIVLCQFISNVPAAVLLSGFTENVRSLLMGVNVGGLGTLIASLASIISYRAYAGTKNARKGSYIKTFSIYNLIFLIILTLFSFIIQ